jgi:hypothetical protein
MQVRVCVRVYMHTHMYVYNTKAHIIGYRQLTSRNWGVSVGIAARLLVAQQGSRGSIQGEDKWPRVQTGSGPNRFPFQWVP